MNINNGKTGNVNIPGALHSTGGDGDGQIGGVVAYAGDVYDETLGKNQKEINQTLLNGSADSNVIAVALNDLNEKVEEQEKVISNALNDLDDKVDKLNNNESSLASDIDELQDAISDIASNHFISQVDGGGTVLTTSEHKSGYSYSEHISLPRAIGLGSVSSGDKCIAFGKASTAIGRNTIAIGNNSFIAGYNSFNYSEFSVFNKDTYLQDGYIGIAWTDPYEATRGMVMVFRDENDQINKYELITNVEYGPYDGANTKWSGKDCLKLYYDTSHIIDMPNYLELSTAATGQNSVCLGYNTVTTNDGEVAVGCCNITHGGQTKAEKTMFSVGIGVNKLLDYTQDGIFKNALEIMWDGSIYVKGIGGYNGQSLSGTTDLLNVITGINTRLATLEDVQITAENVTYDSTETYTSGTVGYAIQTGITASAASAAAASSSASTASGYYSDILTAMGNLGSGEAVAAQVAINQADIAELKSDIVVDLSSRYSTSYANLSAALTALNSDIATDAATIKKAGVSIKFINSSTNKYEQWNLKASSWSTNTSDWALDADGSISNGKLKLPFELEKPSSNEYVTQASEIGHNNKSVADYISEIEDMFEYVDDDTPAICGQAICGQAICGVI